MYKNIIFVFFKYHFHPGVSTIEMVMSLIFIQLVVHILQTAIVMSVLYLVYNNPMEGSLFTLCALMLITGTSGMFYGNFFVYSDWARMNVVTSQADFTVKKLSKNQKYVKVRGWFHK